MNTTTMISEIEKILPPGQKREWILQKKKPRTMNNLSIYLTFFWKKKMQWNTCNQKYDVNKGLVFITYLKQIQPNI